MNEKQIFDHMINFHDKNRGDLMREVYEASFDVNTLHEQTHTEEVGHTHGGDGSITQESKTVLNGKNLTLTSGGWSFDSTAAEALQELNSIINNHPVEFKFVHEDGVIKGLLYHEWKSVSIEGADFLTAVRLLLGEIYNYLDERDENEPRAAGTGSNPRAV